MSTYHRSDSFRKPPSSRFRAGDVVSIRVIHRASIVGEQVISFKEFTIHRATYNPGVSTWVYQLEDISTGKLYSEGRFVPEKSLKSVRSRRTQPDTPRTVDFETRSGNPDKTSTNDPVIGIEPFIPQSIDVREESQSYGSDIQGVPQVTSSTVGSKSTIDSGSHGSDSQGVSQGTSLTAETKSIVDSGYASEEKKTAKDDQVIRPIHASRSTVDDTGSVYSDQSSVASGSRDMYIAEIAADILEHISGEVVSGQVGSMDRLYEQLPRLLKGFAIDLASVDRTQESRDAMVFISKHRHAIVAQLRRLCESEAARDKSAAWTIEEKIDHWRTSVDRDIQNEDETFIGVNDFTEAVDESDETEGNRIPTYKNLIITSQAHQWLISRIEHVVITERPELDGCQSIGEMILADISASQSLRVISRSQDPGKYEARFSMLWSPSTFFQEQGYDVEYDVFLHQAIALTGREHDAQATTVEQYLRQCWPRVSNELLDVLEAAKTRASSEKETMLLKLVYQQSGDEALISVVGNAEAMAEVGEAISWLGAALRSSNSGKLSSCRPSVVLKQQGDGYLAWNITHSTIDVPLPCPEDAMRGRCWVSLFQEPTLVKGFPILKKPEGFFGLEMRLNIMAALVDSPRITNFAGTIFIKGFSSALVLTKHTKTACAWHLLTQDDGTHLSYDDPRVKALSPVQGDTLNIHELESVRHFVGWCSRVRALTGLPEASYDIRQSKLSRTKPGFAFEKVSISGGKFLSVGLSGVLSKKDKDIMRSRKDYKNQLDWIADKYVVLFDVVDRRAWLVDGISALLHLVRASLRHGATNDFKDYFMFKSEHMAPIDNSKVGKQAAISVLMNTHNQNLPLHKSTDEDFEETTIGQGLEPSQATMTHKKKTTYYRLKDRVDELYHVLEQMITYQSQSSTEDGIAFKVRKSPRERLEGYEFTDVAMDHDPIRPRFITLRSVGKGWVDLVREIDATILFGSGFGELLKPAGKTDNCGWWTKVPTGSDHLAVSVLDLEGIMSRWGNKAGASWQLVDNVHWHCPDKLFEACQCEADSTQSHCDRVQVLLPPKLLGVFKRKLKSPAALEEQGAVIFGHSRTLPLTWDEHGGVQEGIPDEPVEPMHDTCGESETSSSWESDKNLSANSTLTMSGVEISPTPPSTQASLAPVFGKRSRSPSRLQALKEMVRLH